MFVLLVFVGAGSFGALGRPLLLGRSRQKHSAVARGGSRLKVHNSRRRCTILTLVAGGDAGVLLFLGAGWEVDWPARVNTNWFFGAVIRL